jgi:hypothetical protein
MKPMSSDVLAELHEQHDELRAIIARCEVLADDLDMGKADAATLTREVVRLRVAFEAHIKFEEQLIRPGLLAPHAREHRVVGLQLGDATTNALRAALDSLRAHLEDEERQMACPMQVVFA